MDSPGTGGRGGGGANAGVPGSGRRRRKKPPRERGNSEGGGGGGRKPPPMILSKVAGLDNKDIDKASGSERSSRPSRAASPGPQIKIKVRDREDTPTHSQPLPSTGSPSHTTTPVTPKPVPVAKVKQGSEGDPRGRSSTPTGRLYSPSQRVTGGQMPGISIEVPIHKRLASPTMMSQPIKLIDNAFQWVDVGSEYLLEQTDFLVIGVLGVQGCGKSTLMSLLAGNKHTDPHSSFIFKPQTSSNGEQALHQTTGMEMFISEERIILLDTQPILSSSIMDRLLGPDKQTIPPEYSSAENYAEMQSLYIAAFLLTVCHVVMVVEDWFSDINIIEFIKRAEMLKPATPPPPSNQSENSNLDDPEDFVPNIVFVQNKASRECFQPITVNAMQQAIHSLMMTSKLKYTGCSSLARSSVMPCLSSKTLPLDLNLFLLPRLDSNKNRDEKESKTSAVDIVADPGYVGHPKPERLVTAFRNQMYAASRPLLTHSSLNEKNWYQYASRTWENIKKSSLMSEYHRLLT
ncbi:nonsense-mediated mRNA decay factor SMG9-like isoform X2 [Lytechinus pictus]|uniref:nonsense-mediated mRNA decay factor SMG9-like isoform X2 n=2 Tax=Lytechinus pictus TaxID=7653 RepID=UPI0030B9EF96